MRRYAKLACFFGSLFFSAQVHSQPIRGNYSQGLDPTYVTLPLYQSTAEASDCYEDDFLLPGSATPGIYEVNYSSQDPITMVSLAGGQILAFERLDNGRSVRVQFSVPSEKEGINSYLYFKIFTESLFDEAANAPGLLEALKGAWFDGEFGHPVRYPFFSDEGHDLIAVTFSAVRANADNTFRMFLPTAAINYLNENETLVTDNIRLLKTVPNIGSKEVDFHAAQSVEGGVLLTSTHTYDSDANSAQYQLSALGKTGLYARGRESRKSSFSLTAVVKDCQGTEELKLERRLEGEDTYRKFKTLTLTSCEAVVTTKLNKPAQFRFKFGKKFYVKKIKIRGARRAA